MTAKERKKALRTLAECFQTELTGYFMNHCGYKKELSEFCEECREHALLWRAIGIWKSKGAVKEVYLKAWKVN